MEDSKKELVELTMEKFESLVKGVEEKINGLEKELEEKQSTIINLNAEIAKRDNKIEELAARLTNLANNSVDKETEFINKINEQIKIINNLRNTPERHLLLKLLNQGWFYRAFRSKKELRKILYSKTSL